MGDRVLEIGAGIGRYTVELIKRGAKVEATDISEVQLEANIVHVAAEGCQYGVVGRSIQTMTDLSDYGSESFDMVLAYGGSLSYAMDNEPQALREMLRVVKAGGFVVGSVMSRLGMMRYYYENRPEEMTDETGPEGEPVDSLGFFLTGDRRFKPNPSGHMLKLLSWTKMQTIAEIAGTKMIAGSASNFLSMISEEKLAQLKASPKVWANFLEREMVACQSPGAIDVGTHILYAACKR